MRKVVLLLGPSSAGKSTTCAELKKTHGWHVSSGDDVNDAINQVRTEKLRIALEASGLLVRLQDLMTEKEVLALARHGLMTISKGDHRVTNHQFKGPTYPGVRECLTSAGFLDAEVETHSALIESVGKVFIEFRDRYQRPDFVKALLDDAFSRLDHDDASVVIDHIPADDTQSTQKFIARFEERVKNFKETHGQDSIHSSIVLAYCPPEQLSKRILIRNEEAEASGNLNNRRQGTFPFDQLGALVQVGMFCPVKNNRVGQISRDQLIGISHRHQRPEDQEKERASSLDVATSVVDSLLNAVSDYVHLSERYGVGRDQVMQDLIVRPEFHDYPRINTAQGTSEELAQQVIAASALQPSVVGMKM